MNSFLTIIDQIMILNNLLKVPKVNKMVLPLKNFLNNESKRNLNLLIKYLNHENDSRIWQKTISFSFSLVSNYN